MMDFASLNTITSIKNQQLRVASKLLTRQGRKKSNLCLIDGYRQISLAKSIESLFVADSEAGKKALCNLIELRDDHLADVHIYKLPTKLLAELSSVASNEGLVAVCHKPELHNLTAEVCQKLSFIERPLVLLEDIQDPLNCGTIIRTAEALGFAGMILSPNCVDAWHPVALRGAMGSQFHLPMYQYQNLEETVSWLKQSAYQLLATDLSGEKLDWHSKPSSNTVVVMGNEGQGISKAMCQLVEQRICIPMYGKAESLNVASSFAMLAGWISSHYSE